MTADLLLGIAALALAVGLLLGNGYFARQMFAGQQELLRRPPFNGLADYLRRVAPRWRASGRSRRLFLRLWLVVLAGGFAWVGVSLIARGI